VISPIPEYIDYSELAFPDGYDELDWADVPGGHLNWVDYWMKRYEAECDDHRASKALLTVAYKRIGILLGIIEKHAHVAFLHRLINFAKVDIPSGDIESQVTMMLQRIRNQKAIIEEQRRYIHKLEDELGYPDKKVS